MRACSHVAQASDEKNETARHRFDGETCWEWSPLKPDRCRLHPLLPLLLLHSLQLASTPLPMRRPSRRQTPLAKCVPTLGWQASSWMRES
mmetsp:Transcript_28530/g.92540  ORF Transcript_28530/g.92540 Transcript_28530/m.92540 type:complete len:90 (+) Transcript_28530:224-493(+)